MMFLGEIQAGKLLLNDLKSFNDFLASQKDGQYEICIKRWRKKRSLSQNSALHLWFTQLAKALNEAGYDMKKVIREELEIPWTAHTIKEHLWRPVQREYLQKHSTTELETQDIDKIFDIINKTIGERTGVHIEFPCIEALAERDLDVSQWEEKPNQ